MRKKIPTVEMMMTKSIVCLSPDETVAEAVKQLIKYRISGAPVVENGKLIGVLTEKDCLKYVMSMKYNSLPAAAITVRELMSTDITTILSTKDIFAASQIFLNNFRRLPVVDYKNNLLGIISRHDILVASQSNWSTLAEDNQHFVDYQKPCDSYTKSRAIPKPYDYVDYI